MAGLDEAANRAAKALAAGDPLSALKRVGYRDDAIALAIRGTAMAQLGELERARLLLRSASRAFGAAAPVQRARCQLAEAEIALVCRDLGRPLDRLETARRDLRALGDDRNAAHADCLAARRELLLGHLERAEAIVEGLRDEDLLPASRVSRSLTLAEIAMRRIRPQAARAALTEAGEAVRAAGIPALGAEVSRALGLLQSPAARLVGVDGETSLSLEAVADIVASGRLVVDACRNRLSQGAMTVDLARRPVLFALIRTLAEAWPGDASRARLLIRAFGSRHQDESQRVRLRVEIARLREAIAPLAQIRATASGFALGVPQENAPAVLAPPNESRHGPIRALLADGEAWSSSGLALVLGVSPRTVQRALESMAAGGEVDFFGRGPARRWILRGLAGFPTVLLLPVAEKSA